MFVVSTIPAPTRSCVTVGGRLALWSTSKNQHDKPDGGRGVGKDQHGEQREDQGAGAPADWPGLRRHRQQHQDNDSFDDGHDRGWPFSHRRWHKDLRKDHQDKSNERPAVALRCER